MMQIQAGTYKGRKLLSPPPAAQTRPLTGLAKKSLFDTLSAWLEGGRIVDLYAGTGTIGLEALSRGAHCCYLAEKDPRVVARLKRNIAQLGLQQQTHIWVGDVERQLAGWMRSIEAPADVVFLDPPFAQAGRWQLDQKVPSLFSPIAEHLATDGVVVLRLPPKSEPPEVLGPLRLVRRRKKGSMGLFYLQKPEAP
jgi:16S rRNA (guanine(966)-N(2))-methyltransferase RsmD